jgi:ABC-2 type transport system ATP-binding protein
MRLLLGMLRPDGGTAEVLGCPVVEAGRAVWSRVGHLIETPPRYGELTVAESVYSAARLQGWDRPSARVAAAGSSPIWSWTIGSIVRLARCRWAIGNVSGSPWPLVHRPDVLVLDEPKSQVQA